MSNYSSFTSTAAAASYLAAMFDGEGTVGQGRWGGQKAQKAEIVNTNRQVIDACLECCSMLDLGYSFYEYEYGGRLRYIINWARREYFVKLLSQVPILATRKLAVLRSILESYKPRYRADVLDNWRSEALALFDPAGYLGGLIDGEGTMSLSGTSTRVVRIANTDLDIIHAAEQVYAALGIPTSTRSRQPPDNPNWAQAYDVYIYGLPQFRLIRDTIPFFAQFKHDRLDEMIASYRDYPIPTKEELVRWYIEEEMSIAEIVAITHAKSNDTVHKWLKHYDIPRRSLAEAAIIFWKRRKQGGGGD